MIKIIPLEERYLEDLMLIRNKHTSFLRQEKQLTCEDQLKWFNNKKDCVIFSVLQNARFIGAAGLTYIDMKTKKAEISIILDNYIDNRADDVINKIVEYGFNELELNKIYNEVYEYDQAKMKALLKNNFQLDGILREDHLKNDVLINIYVYSVLKSEWVSS
jgi:RimJ/RimL family protein N-acetyltransferase